MAAYAGVLGTIIADELGPPATARPQLRAPAAVDLVVAIGLFFRDEVSGTQGGKSPANGVKVWCPDLDLQVARHARHWREFPADVNPHTSENVARQVLVLQDRFQPLAHVRRVDRDLAPRHFRRVE